MEPFGPTGVASGEESRERHGDGERKSRQAGDGRHDDENRLPRLTMPRMRANPDPERRTHGQTRREDELSHEMPLGRRG